MSLLIPDTGLLFWMLLSFGIVFGVLAKYGFPVIVKMVENRSKYIDESLVKAKEANKLLANVKTETEMLIAQANKEQGRILKESMQEREKIIRDARREAKEASRKELELAKKQIQKEKEDAIREVRRQVAVLSVDIAEKVIRKKIDSNDEQMAMIERMLDEVTKKSS